VTTFSDKISLLEKFRRLKVGSFDAECMNGLPTEDYKFEVTSPSTSKSITLSEENSVAFVEDRFLNAVKPMVPYRLSLVSSSSETELIKYLGSKLSDPGLKLTDVEGGVREMGIVRRESYGSINYRPEVEEEIEKNSTQGDKEKI